MAIDPLSDDRQTPEPSQAKSQDQTLQIMLSGVWERSRHTVAERAALLLTAGALWDQNRLDPATRGRAVDSAHKLAGVLGMFGLPRGTDLAREAECLFGQEAPSGRTEIERLQVLLAELAALIEKGPTQPS